MSIAPTHYARIALLGEPVWAIAELFPAQGDWSERQYLALSTQRLVEFDNGILEFLPAATRSHQVILGSLLDRLGEFVAGRGLVLFSPYKLRIPTGKFREPDVIYLTPEQNAESNEDFAISATVAMEVVSPDEPSRDYVAKRADYAAAGVAEYWIVDKDLRQVLVLRLGTGGYVEHGKFGPGQTATSHALPGFAVPVDSLLSVGQ